MHHAFGDLVGEVARVELGDAAHDAVHQHSRRGLVDVLAGADQGHSRLLEREVDRYVVGPGAGQTIQLVNDAVIHLVLANVSEHALQLGAFGRRRAGLSGIHELFNDYRTQRFRFACVGLALGGNGESLLPPATLGLVDGRDAKISDRSLGTRDTRHIHPHFYSPAGCPLRRDLVELCLAASAAALTAGAPRKPAMAALLAAASRSISSRTRSA